MDGAINKRGNKKNIVGGSIDFRATNLCNGSEERPN